MYDDEYDIDHNLHEPQVSHLSIEGSATSGSDRDIVRWDPICNTHGAGRAHQCLQPSCLPTNPILCSHVSYTWN